MQATTKTIAAAIHRAAATHRKMRQASSHRAAEHAKRQAQRQAAAQ